MKKPPAAIAGDGLGVALLLNPVGQALFPARALWTLIRWAGIGASVHGTGKKLASMAEVCMSLKKSRPERRGARQDARRAQVVLQAGGFGAKLACRTGLPGSWTAAATQCSGVNS